MNPHPACELFPPLDDAALQSLAADIKANGLLEPIITMSGQILDGRNRFAACKLVGVEPVLKDVADVPAFRLAKSDPWAFVVSRNLHRRHLSEPERSMIAEKVANMKHGGDRTKSSIEPLTESKSISDAAKIANMKQHDNQHTVKVDGSIELTTKKSIAYAAKLLNVSPASVKRARVVREKGVPELVKAVESGKVSVSAAAQVASLAPAEQEKVIAAGAEAVKKRAKEVSEAKSARILKRVIPDLSGGVHTPRNAFVAAPEPEPPQDAPVTKTNTTIDAEVSESKTVEQACEAMHHELIVLQDAYETLNKRVRSPRDLDNAIRWFSSSMFRHSYAHLLDLKSAFEKRLANRKKKIAEERRASRAATATTATAPAQEVAS